MGTTTTRGPTVPARFAVVGVSARSASPHVLDPLLLDTTTADAVLASLRDHLGPEEALVLATCTRTELWVAGGDRSTATTLWRDVVEAGRPASPSRGGERYGLDGDAAVRHVLRVACGLDSAILGDVEILGHLRRALEGARRGGTVGPVLGGMVATALRAGRRAQRETEIGWGHSGVGTAVSTMVAAHRDRVGLRPAVVVVGAGRAGRSVARAIVDRGLPPPVVVNRRAAAAARLARDVGGRAEPWAGLEACIADADVVVVATAAPAPVLSTELQERVRRARPERPLTVIDLGAPGNAAPCAGVLRFGLEAVQDHRAGAVSRRRAAVPHVEALVEAELEAWRRSQWRQPVEAILAQLHADAEAVSREAAAVLTAPVGVPATPAETEEVIMRSFERVLHGHAERLRALAPGGA